MMNDYVAEKLRQLDEERFARALTVKRALEEQPEQPRSKPVIGPLVRVAGRTLRRAGEGIEAWASPRAEPEQQLRPQRRAG